MLMSYFDEEWYLHKYPDVRTAIARGDVASGRDHFRSHGQAEGRLACDPKLLDRLAEADKLASRVCHFDQMFVTNSGFALILGWIDSRTDSVQSITFAPFVGQPISLARSVVRYFREDVSEKKIRDDRNFDHGFWILFDGLAGLLPHLGGHIKVEFASGRTGHVEIAAQLVSPEELRGRVLETMSRPIRLYSPLANLADIVVPLLQRLNLDLAARISVPPPVLHGSRRGNTRLSIIVVPQRPDWMVRQAALFAGVAATEEVEFIYISGRPEGVAAFHAMADNVHTLYGHTIVSMSASDNLGVAAASACAAQVAAAPALLFLSDGIVPADFQCLTRALHIADGMGQQDVVGALLLTEDNSIHQMGRSLQVADRLNHYWGYEDNHKGLPADGFRGRSPFEVDSAGMAAMLVKRTAFLENGGFNDSYLSDEYQDSDYCLRARAKKGRVVVDPQLLFYRLEGRQAIPRQPRDWAVASMDMLLFNTAWQSTIERSSMSLDNEAQALAAGKAGER